jgi:hypothetical protein
VERYVAGSSCGGPNPPPARHNPRDLFSVFLRSDNSHEIQGPAIDSALRGQPFQRICLTLDFVSVQTTVDNGEVYSRCALAQTQFMKDEGIVGVLVKTMDFGVEAATDIDIADLTLWHGYSDCRGTGQKRKRYPSAFVL